MGASFPCFWQKISLLVEEGIVRQSPANRALWAKYEAETGDFSEFSLYFPC